MIYARKDAPASLYLDQTHSALTKLTVALSLNPKPFAHLGFSVLQLVLQRLDGSGI